MLNFERAKSIKCRVEVSWNTGLGRVKKEDFVLEFEILTQSQIDDLDALIMAEIIDKRDALNSGEIPSRTDPRVDAILESAIGWEGVVDLERNSVEFSVANLRSLMEDRAVRGAVIETFRTEILGKEAERKN